MLLVVVNEKREVVFQESVPRLIQERTEMEKIIQRTLEEKNPVFIGAGRLDSKLHVGENTPGEFMKNILCFPLFTDSQPFAAVCLDRTALSGSYSKKNLDLLTDFSKPLTRMLAERFPLASRKSSLTSGQHSSFSAPELVGRSQPFQAVLKLIAKVRDIDAPVFIWGESGTGKELVARIIHQTGKRKNGRFVTLNCGAIPEHLLESELFGYKRGSFTGALREKPGLIEEADGGTFFLDEIGDLSLPLQAKFLRLLQEKETRRIGENRTRHVDVRFISATNKNIDSEVERGSFREDLYYRLKIITIKLAPLRERKADIFFLLNHFVEKYCKAMNLERVCISPETVEFFMNYSWPGNIRELQNEIQRCLILCGEENLIKPEHVSSKIKPSQERELILPHNYFHAKAEFERSFLAQALSRSQYNRTRTAEDIGLSRQGLFKLIKKHKMEEKL